MIEKMVISQCFMGDCRKTSGTAPKVFCFFLFTKRNLLLLPYWFDLILLIWFCMAVSSAETWPPLLVMTEA